ncbi:hypothetical protein M1P56_16920 [Streptomyces sp. HU2014]|uniref:Uncharacterized protein n=1 Tax=Streptomyces albireticuli TaxID=1940 RepID=A0A1Z2LE91_9ACTN|nr:MULTISPECIES: hypothetical protein [Streptomyces]ARZ72609.1 hypothetical protein SMD11_7033 [Streptomyces albireticuli]UQI45918.1 hypothetical protein M1P56_16920 [Streptomyces sp. HU2014]
MRETTAGFCAATGNDFPPVAGAGSEDRAAAVLQAVEALRRIREVVNPAAGRSVSVPAQWERLQPVRAIALALEAAQVPASAVDAGGHRVATGYSVRDHDGVVRVEWVGPAGSHARYEQHECLQRCAQALEELGWQTLEYRGARGQRWLEAEALA